MFVPDNQELMLNKKGWRRLSRKCGMTWQD